ncbi:two-component regulator propeller domain-containing protein, partial [Salmonella enterica]|uniref:two-component regulator propeller domain-containing protein n=1 Tax=Salmonella enterica TaxID=28901 RepID=UPI003CF5655F
KKALAFLLLLVLMFAAYSKAQPYHLSFKHLTVDNGLPVGHVTKFFKDSQGFLWVGSDNGLARFDGSNVVHYLTGNKDSVQTNGSF